MRKVKDILSLDTKTIIKGMLPSIIGTLILWQNPTSIGRIVAFFALVFIGVYYLFTGEYTSPIFFILSAFIPLQIAVTLFRPVNILLPELIPNIIPTILQIYFFSLGIGYFIFPNRKGRFIESGIISIIYIVLIHFSIEQLWITNANLIKMIWTFSGLISILLILLAFIYKKYKKKN